MARRLCYAMQLYFDFSGYSDMALGLARMFSLQFPINFHSPYKSASIIEYWTHQHMTLTRYLNEYVYTPILRWVNNRRMTAGKKSNRKAAATPSGYLQMVLFPTHDHHVHRRYLARRWPAVPHLRRPPWRLPQHQPRVASSSLPALASTGQSHPQSWSSSLLLCRPSPRLLPSRQPP